jgi:chorismate mutase
LDIEDWRDEIDRIDERLVEVLNRRLMCCVEIGRIKRERGLPIYSAEREAQVLDHVAHVNAGPLERDAIRRLFERIIDEARRMERVTMEPESAQAAPDDDIAATDALD